MTTMDQIHRIRELFYEQGKNLNEIAIIMNCDWRTVRKYVDMEDFSSPPPAPLRNEEHVILGQEMLKPRDGAEKDEGELTGGKRLIERLRQRHGHFADVIVADALYLNAPFINTIKENGLEAVIRLKDEKRLIFQDAEGLFNRGEGKARSFQRGKKTVEVWDLSGFEIENCPYRLRVVNYHEMWLENGKKAE